MTFFTSPLSLSIFWNVRRVFQRSFQNIFIFNGQIFSIYSITFNPCPILLVYKSTGGEEHYKSLLPGSSYVVCVVFSLFFNSVWASYFYQFFVFARRYAYLTLLFTPVTILFLLSGLTGNEIIYNLSLDTLAYTLSNAGSGLQKFAQWVSMRPGKIKKPLHIIPKSTWKQSDF